MSIQRLDKQLITQNLDQQKFSAPIKLHILHSVDSTNRFLRDLPFSSTTDICCAETQTNGRGRFGRSWYSPFAQNIYCSSRWYFEGELNRLTGLGLVVSIAILATLKDLKLQDQIGIKWPNDLIWHDKKLCGSLIEIIPQTQFHIGAIIGIGLNVNSSQTSVENHEVDFLPDKPWCSLYDINKSKFDRNLILTQLIIQLHQHMKLFIKDGLGAFMSEWHKVDYLYGKRITVHRANESLSGIANGINEIGQLILIDDTGTIHYLSSGDTTLHT